MPLLSDIVGQGPAVERLGKLLAGPRMPHALLFLGPDGVGRRTTAEAVAQALLCAQPVKIDAAGRIIDQGPSLLAPAEEPGEPVGIQACGRCEECRLFKAGSHGDFHLVYKELARYHEDSDVRSRVMQSLGIEVIRSFLIAPAGRAATRGRGKIFIVLDAELMTTEAQNALLKTLEEPPPGVKIILIAEQADQLLPTTLSRCSPVRFGLLPRDFVTDKLLQAGVDQQEAAFWAAFTDGQLGRALDLGRQGMYQIKRELLDRLAAMGPAGDGSLSESLIKTAESLADQQVKRVKTDQGVELSRNLALRTAAGAVLELLASVYRDAMSQAAGSDRPLVHADQPDAIAAVSARLDITRLAGVVEQLSELEQMLWRNVSPKIVWDNVAISCAGGGNLGI